MPTLEPTSNSSLISLRLWVVQWSHPERCEGLLRLVSDYRDAVDEVTFITGEIHPPLPLATIEARAATLAAIMPRFKALGLSTGINHLSTVGHHEEYVARALSEPYQHMVDSNGTTTQGAFCPSDPGMQSYIARSYIALARAKPDFIWIDDDVRLFWHPPAGYSCFCDRCLARFGHATARSWTRAELIEALNAEPLQQRLGLRRQWLDLNRDSLNEVLRVIREAVDTVDNRLPLGLMSCALWYEGFDYDRWLTTLAGRQGAPTKARPGNGFYADDTPGDMLGKAHLIGAQVAAMPDAVTDIQSEHENFPYQMLRKSEHIFASEIAVYIAAGCTGTALNLMGTSDDPLDEFLPLFEKVRGWRHFYDALVATFGRSRCEGLWAAANPDIYAVKSVDGDWFDAEHLPGSLGYLRELSEIGFPCAYRHDGAALTLLCGDSPLVFPIDQLTEMLGGGVLLDGAAAGRLLELGLGQYIGFSIGGRRDADSVEALSDDGLNGRFSGWRRDARPSFWKGRTYLLEPTDDRARTLSNIVDLWGNSSGIGSGVFENDLGGRVATMGYAPWSMLQTLAKTSQLKNVVRWLARDNLPGYVGAFHRGALWCRRKPDGGCAMLLLNNSLDCVTGLRLHVREARDYTILRPELREEPLRLVGHDGPYGVLELPHMAPWQMALIR